MVRLMEVFTYSYVGSEVGSAVSSDRDVWRDAEVWGIGFVNGEVRVPQTFQHSVLVSVHNLLDVVFRIPPPSRTIALRGSNRT
jgi:hypothetical protein